MERLEPTDEALHYLCLDKRYGKRLAEEIGTKGDCVPHVWRVGEEKLDETKSAKKRYLARRRVVERMLGWHSRCRTILILYEKEAATALG